MEDFLIMSSKERKRKVILEEWVHGRQQDIHCILR